MSKPWHAKDTDQVLNELNGAREGLTSQDAAERLRKSGANELTAKKGKTALDIFISQFKDIFILLLIVATIFSGIVGYYEFLLANQNTSLKRLQIR